MSGVGVSRTQGASARPLVQPAPRPAAPTRAPLRLVPPPARTGLGRSRAPRTPFVLLVLVLLAGGLAGLLMLNTVVDQDAFRLHRLLSSQTALDVQEAQLREQADADADPATLAARAVALGMVADGPVAYVRSAKLPKGKRIGNLIVVPGATPPPAPAPAPAAAVPAPAAAATAPVTGASAAPAAAARPKKSTAPVSHASAPAPVATP